MAISMMTARHESTITIVVHTYKSGRKFLTAQFIKALELLNVGGPMRRPTAGDLRCQFVACVSGIKFNRQTATDCKRTRKSSAEART